MLTGKVSVSDLGRKAVTEVSRSLQGSQFPVLHFFKKYLELANLKFCRIVVSFFFASLSSLHFFFKLVTFKIGILGACFFVAFCVQRCVLALDLNALHSEK